MSFHERPGSMNELIARAAPWDRSTSSPESFFPQMSVNSYASGNLDAYLHGASWLLILATHILLSSSELFQQLASVEVVRGR